LAFTSPDRRAILATMSAAAPARPLVDRLPPHAWFLVSAIFHYLGPSFAVLLFASIAPSGVAWLRIASAGLVFAIWRRPWRFFAALPRQDQTIVIALGVVLAVMNTVFYEAIARLPLATVGAIEFLGPIAVAAGAPAPGAISALSARCRRGLHSHRHATCWRASGYVYAFANCGLFVLYILLGHRVASAGAGIDRLGAAMLIATVAAFPVGIHAALPALSDPVLLAAGVGVGVSSSVIPYVCDQLAMLRLPRATFALLLSLLPATAAAIGFLVLDQVPTLAELLAILLVIGGVALHRPES